MNEFMDSVIPKKIRLKAPMSLDAPLSESEALTKLGTMVSKNKPTKNYIGMGFYETLTPGVILRNVRLGIFTLLMMSID